MAKRLRRIVAAGVGAGIAVGALTALVVATRRNNLDDRSRAHVVTSDVPPKPTKLARTPAEATADELALRAWFALHADRYVDAVEQYRHAYLLVNSARNAFNLASAMYLGFDDAGAVEFLDRARNSSPDPALMKEIERRTKLYRDNRQAGLLIGEASMAQSNMDLIGARRLFEQAHAIVSDAVSSSAVAIVCEQAGDIDAALKWHAIAAGERPRRPHQHDLDELAAKIARHRSAPETEKSSQLSARGDAAMATGHYFDARRMFEQAFDLTKNPKDAIKAADACYRNRDFARAVNWLNNARAVHPDAASLTQIYKYAAVYQAKAEVERINIQGLEKLEAHDFESARRLFEQAHATDNDPSYAYNVALANEDLEDFDAAMVWYAASLAEHPTPGTRLQLSMLAGRIAKKRATNR